MKKVITYLDKDYIITKDNKYYKRCTNDKGNNTILCPDNGNYYYEDFNYNGYRKQYTVSEISKKEILMEKI